ncbi:MAG: YhdP family protein [Arenicellales bacterium]
MRSKQETNLLAGLWPWFRITCIHCARLAWYFGITLFVVAAAAITIFRFWLPALVDRKVEVETYLTKQIGQSVVIGEMAADWQGLYPSLHARKLALKDASGKEDVQLSLGELRLDLDILPLLQGKFVFRQITLKNPVVHVRRTAEGEFYIGKVKAPPPKEGRLALLFNQYKVNISDGRFIWRDDFLKEDEFSVTNINLSMENVGKRHVLSGRLGLPENVAQAMSLNFDLKGDVLDISTWKGQFNTKLSEVELSALPGIINEKRLIPELSGRASLDISTKWNKGQLEAAAGQLKGRNFLVPLGDYGTPFTVRSVEADIKLEHKGKSWLLTLDNPFIAIAGKPWSAGRIKASYGIDESSVHISKLELADLRPVLDALTSENKIVQLVKSLYPVGNASDTSLTLFGPIKKPHDFLYKMSVSEATVNAYSLYPAATGLSANISVTRTGGSVIAEGKNSRIVLDRVYERALRIDDLQATVSWYRGDEDWQVDGKQLWLKNKDAEAHAKFIATVPLDHTLPPLLTLNVDLVDGDLSHADKYFPVRLMKPGIRKWFEDTDFRGRLNQAKLDYEGTAKGFPVAGAKSFKVVANIEAGSMVFAADWPRLTGIEADLLISENDLWVKGMARDLHGQRVKDSTVHISHLAETGRQVVDVRTGLHGNLAEVVGFLQTGPLFRNTAFQEINLGAKGVGKIKLDVSIPLADASGTRVKGTYNTADASLQLPDDSWITKLKGKLDFTERSLSSAGFQGMMLGGPLTFSVKTLKEGQPPVVEVEATGEAHASQMEPILGDRLVKELSGKTAWQGKMKFDPEVVSLNVNSDLTGLASSFPYPLTKESNESLPLKLDVSFLANNRTKLAFFMPAFINGKLIFSIVEDEMALTGGCLLIGKGKAACDDKDGLSVAVEQAFLDLDPWDNYLKKQEDDDGLPEVLTRMTANIGTAFYAGVDMADITTEFDRQKDASWQGTISGGRIKGNIGFSWERSSRWVKMQLVHLIWNEAEKETAPAEIPQDPQKFPALNVTIDDLVFHNMKLGRLSMQGEPTVNEWELQLLKLDRPDMKVVANGHWRGQSDGHSSSFDVDFTSADMRTTLAALDYDVDLESELFRTTGSVSWKGAPYDYHLGILDGTLEIHSDKGRLSSVEVGAGRLLGVLNIESLRRRLLLDFSDLSKEGFAFDEIEADLTIKQGVAQISKLLIPGPSATIRLQGQMGLVEENVDMKMSISPAVGGNLAIAGFVLGGPAGGFVTLLASKAIKEQMDKVANYQYTIRGSWEDPVVDKIQSGRGNEEAGSVEGQLE